MSDEHEHRFDPDTDRCVCGGIVVSFDDGDRNGDRGEGCEVADLVWPTKCAICKEPIAQGQEKAEMFDAAIVGMYGDTMTEKQQSEYAGIVHAECGLQRGWEIS